MHAWTWSCRYGPIFRTNLVGEDLIVSLDAELNAHILKQEERGFQIWYPPSFMRVFGADLISKTIGVLHRHMRTLVLRLFGLQTTRSVLLHDVQRSARDELRSWLGRPGVEVRTATSRVSSFVITSFNSASLFAIRVMGGANIYIYMSLCCVCR